MLTTLRLGPLALPTFPLLIIFGLYAGLWLAARAATRRGLNPDHLYNAGFSAALVALIAGRLGHVIRFFPAYLTDPISVLSPNLAAFEPLAASAAAIVLFAWYVRRYRLPVLPVVDALAVGSLLFLAVHALAEGLNGRNFGQPSLLPWTIPQWDVYRHPVQFYEILGILGVISLLWAVHDRLRSGQAVLLAAAGYAAVRLLVDAFRDQPVTIGDGLRLTQVLAWLVLVLALLGLYQMRAGEGPIADSQRSATSNQRATSDV
jgi:phosphatidylglycerol:prolipoprotein diacylglycerol transferase